MDNLFFVILYVTTQTTTLQLLQPERRPFYKSKLSIKSQRLLVSHQLSHQFFMHSFISSIVQPKHSQCSLHLRIERGCKYRFSQYKRELFKSTSEIEYPRCFRNVLLVDLSRAICTNPSFKNKNIKRFCFHFCLWGTPLDGTRRWPHPVLWFLSCPRSK